MTDLGPDPNEGSTDPMVQEYWTLGEDVQDRIRAAGYESESVEGIAVDIHDLLQAADRIKTELAPALLSSQPEAVAEAVKLLRAEFAHVRWHGTSATLFLDRALNVLQPSNEQPL